MYLAMVGMFISYLIVTMKSFKFTNLPRAAYIYMDPESYQFGRVVFLSICLLSVSTSWISSKYLYLQLYEQPQQPQVFSGFSPLKQIRSLLSSSKYGLGLAQYTLTQLRGPTQLRFHGMLASTTLTAMPKMQVKTSSEFIFFALVFLKNFPYCTVLSMIILMK